MFLKKSIKTGQVIFLTFIMLFMAGIQIAESQQVLNPEESYTVRDYGTSGILSYVNGDGAYGWIQDPPFVSLYEAEHFIEFDVSGSGTAASAYLNFSIYNPSTDEIYGTDKSFNLAYYTGSGSVDTSHFGTGDALATRTISGIITDNFVIDVTSEYNTFLSSGGDHFGIRFYDAFWDGTSEGNQIKYIGSQLSVNVVPEPISSVLFIVGATTLGVRQYRKRRKFRLK